MAVDHRLRTYLRRWGLRLRLVEGLAWGTWGLAAGLTLALVLALTCRAVPLLKSHPLTGLAGLLALTGTAAGLAAAWLHPRSLHRLARTLDRRFGLAERLTTALEVGAGRLRTAPTMAAAQLADTLAAAARVDVRAKLSPRAPRRPLLASLVLAAALALSLGLPNPQEDVLLQQAAVRATIEEQIEELETAREEVAQANALTEEERAALLQALEEATAALEEGQATPEEAVAALAEAERALAPLQDPGAADLRASLERAAGQMADSELTRDIAELLARGDYEAAAQALASFADDVGEPLTREEELELARELAQAAEALAQSDPQLAEQLAEAAAAIEQGDISQAREEVRQAAMQMAEAGGRVERQETVEETLAALQEGREQIAQAGST